ncbi:MAG: hypothetical protein KAY37_01025 [Phycisphaerae bacterium]|nr:hypothetical protein [Phycisphaerae bacterium]
MADAHNPLFTRKALLGGAEETTPGTLPTITTPLANTSIYGAQLVPMGFFDEGQRMPDGHYLGHVAATLGAQIGRLTFRQDLRYGDKFVAMLTGAGYVLDTGTYKPTSDMANRKTWGFKLWEDGRLKALAGACGTCTIELISNQRAVANWEWTGTWQAPTDVAMPAQAPNSSGVWIARAATLTLGGSAIAHTERVTIDLGNQVVPRQDLATTVGVAHFLVSEREPRITLDPEARLVAQHDAFGLLLAGTEAAFNNVLTAGANTLTIAAAKCQRRAVNDEERDGRRIDALELQCNADSGDDELTFAAA